MRSRDPPARRAPAPPAPPAPLVSADTLAAVAVSLVAFVVYWRTLYPGLVGDGDTPKFQFIGRILGTPHNPGYPLYVLVSWAFAQIPAGSVAFRINLMSAVFGALSAGLAVRVFRQLGCRLFVASATALALAFGPVLWSQAVVAEVYTLGAFLLLGALQGLLAFGAEPRPAHLYRAIGFVALGLAHHHADMVVVAPAFVAYVLLRDPRTGLRARTLLAGAGLILLGLSMYGFILVRTGQRAPYLGSTASSLSELWGVLRAAQFSNRLFAYSPREWIAVRVPLMARLLYEELGPPATALGLLGLVVLPRRRPREALLLVVGMAGVLSFASNYGVPDIPVFVIPAFLLAWPFAAVGLDALNGRLARSGWGAAGAALAAAVPLLQLLTHYRTHDHHRHTFEMRYFHALVDLLPDHSVILAESYTVDQMVLYEFFGEDVLQGKDVRLAARDAGSAQTHFRRPGVSVFAFAHTRDDLAAQGFRFDALRVPEASLAAHLRGLPEGTIVLAAGRLEQARAAALVADLAVLADVRGVAGGCYAAAGVAGAPGTGSMATDPASLGMAFGPGEEIGRTRARAPVALAARCAGAGGLIDVNGRETIRAPSGLALVEVDPSGRVLTREVLEPGDGFQVPFASRSYPMFRLAAVPDCSPLDPAGFTEIEARPAFGRVLGQWAGRGVPPAALTLYLGSTTPLSPRLVPGVHAPSTLNTQDLRGPHPGLEAALRQALGDDGLSPERLGAAAFVSRVRLEFPPSGGSPPGVFALALDLGGAPSVLLARMQGADGRGLRGAVCRLPAGGVVAFEEGAPRGPFVLGPDDRAHFGDGWRPTEREGAEVFRRTERGHGHVVVSLDRALPLEVRIRARGGEAGGALEVLMNGAPLGVRPLVSGWSDYAWSAPASASARGANVLVLRVEGGGDVAVSRLELEPSGGR